MLKNPTRPEIGNYLAHLPDNRPKQIYGVVVERLPIGLYRIDGAMLTLEQACDRVHQASETYMPPRVLRVPDQPIYLRDPEWRNIGAMSCRRFWAWSIVHGYKEEEYRSSIVNYRGWLLIHASASKDTDPECEAYGVPKAQAPYSAILGMARLVDCTGERGDTILHLEDAIAFENPVPNVAGALLLPWRPSQREPKTYTQRVRAFNRAYLEVHPELKEQYYA